MSILFKDEKCPYCGATVENGLFICSFGAVNCAECGQFVRYLTEEELDKWIKARSLFIEKLKPNTK